MPNGIAVVVAIATCLVLAGCSRFAQHSSKSYTTVVTDSTRDAEKARAECERAGGLFEKGRLKMAELALQDALIADVSYAPAHNNLGRIYFDQGNLYLAAWEFEYARRLLPESAEVLNNLGMVYEAAGQTEKAIEYYGMALSMDQANPEYIGNLARILAREDRDPDQVAVLLRDLLLRDSRPEWTAWAQDQLNLRTEVRVAAHGQSTAAEVIDRPKGVFESLPLPEHIDDLTPPLPERSQ